MPATALATCEIYGTIYDVFGQPAAGATIGVMSVYKNGALILSQTKETTTDVDGYFTLDLPRDSVAVLYANAPGLNLSCLGTPTAIPDADSAELSTIISDVDLWTEVPVVIPGSGASIGAPITGGTAQSVLFVDAAGAFGQDFANFRWDAAANRLILSDAGVEDFGGHINSTSNSDQPALVGCNYAPTTTEPLWLMKQSLESNRNTLNGMLFSQLTLISDPVQGAGRLKPQDGFGHRYEFQADTDVTAHRICLLDMFWTTVAESTRTSALAVSLCNNGSTTLECLRVTPLGVVLPADPTVAMHAVTKQYVDNKPSGGSPAGTGAEIQYRASATTFGAAPGSSIGVSTNFPGTPRAQFTGVVKVLADPSTFAGILELSDRGGGVYMAVSQINNTVPVFSAFQAIHSAANPGILYFGRGTGGFGAPDCARIINFYTGATGQEDTRRLYISKNGSVHVNEQSIVDSTYALTVNSGLGGSFANALQVNGFADFGTAGQGFQVGTLGRLGIGMASGESTSRIQISASGGIYNAIYISDLTAYYGGIQLNSPYAGSGDIGLYFYTNGNFNFAAAGASQAQVKVTANGLELWDGAASQPVKIGAAGSGPGGTGRALYIS
jgi:hypothetical protein